MDPRNSSCPCVHIPANKNVSLRSVCENHTPIQAFGEVLPLFAGGLDHEEAVLLVFRGNLLQDFLDVVCGFLARKFVLRACVQRDFDARAPSGLHIRV